MTGPEADTLSKRRLRTWLRLLGVTRRAENHLREFLRVNHETTLPRFDVMAALWRRRDGISMTELSRMLLVSNGNVTAVVDRLEADGLAQRMPCATDRRTTLVALTEAGLVRFETLADDHERAVDGLFRGLGAADLDALNDILRRAQQGGAQQDGTQQDGAKKDSAPARTGR